MKHIIQLIIVFVLFINIATAEQANSFQSCKHQAQSQYDYLFCVQAELKRQQSRLEQNYKQAFNHIEAFRHEQLRQIQTLWQQYKDAKCQFLYHKHSGSGGQVDAEECVLKETIQRADELRDIY